MAVHVAKAEMLIRRPVADAFRAFVDPVTITRFWLKATSGPLAKDARVHWTFMVPGASETVSVTAFEPDRLIAFDWSNNIAVTINFAAYGERATRITVRATGFKSDDVVEQVCNATEGFTIVLCDLKTLLEGGRSANLVKDKAELIIHSGKGA